MTTPEGGLGSPMGDASVPDEARLFEYLERYLESLHSGDLASRSALIERNPELARWVRCLELLDRRARHCDEGGVAGYDNGRLHGYHWSASQREISNFVQQVFCLIEDTPYVRR